MPAARTIRVVSSPARPLPAVARRPGAGPSGRRGSIGWWYAGMILDLVHMPLVIAMVLLGASRWHGTTYVTIVTVLVVLQIGLMGCPVMALTRWMKRKHDPSYDGPWSLTMWMYHRYGRSVGVAIFVFFVALAVGLRALFF